MEENYRRTNSVAMAINGRPSRALTATVAIEKETNLRTESYLTCETCALRVQRPRGAMRRMTCGSSTAGNQKIKKPLGARRWGLSIRFVANRFENAIK